MSEVKVTKKNFGDEVLKSTGKVLVDFWATWCGPCQMLGPVLKEIAAEQEGKLKVCKINVDEEGELAQLFRIQSIPTLILFQDGKPAKQMLGYAPKKTIEEFVK